MALILVVDDDALVSDSIAAQLRSSDHQVEQVGTGLAALTRVRQCSYSLVILDRILPDLDGLSVLTTLRSAGFQVPVLMLSALGQTDDRVSGLRAGGDDYLVKPFEWSELLARTDALLRRSGLTPSAPITSIIVGSLNIDLISRMVTIRGTVVDLSPTEYRIMECMARNHGRVVTRKMLFEDAWGYTFDPGTNLINVHVSVLRKKIESYGLPSLIKTVVGEGFRLLVE